MNFGLKKRSFKYSAGYLVVVLLVGLASCAKPDEIGTSTGEIRVVKDDLGRKVNLPPKVERAVSLAPNITELIFAAGAGDKLVGVTTYCDYPAEARAMEKIGDTQTPNIERIIALRPQVVFVSTASQLEAFAKTLDEQAISVFVVDVRGVGDVPKAVRHFGEIFNSPGVADVEADALEQRIEAVAAYTSQVYGKQASKPKVFLQLSEEPLFTIGHDSFLTELIERAGGISSTRDLPTGYPKLSKETALALQPDVIILSDSEDNQKPNAVFKDSPAVKDRRVFKVNADILSRPGPRLVDALESISHKICGCSE